MAEAGMPSNPVGESLWVRHRGYPVHHQRLVLGATLDGESFFVATPDFECYLENFGRENGDIDSVKWSLPDGSPPPGCRVTSAIAFALGQTPIAWRR